MRRLTTFLSLVQVLPLLTVSEVKTGRFAHVTGSGIYPQVVQIVSRVALPQRIRNVGLGPLWSLAGAQLAGSNSQNEARSMKPKEKLF
jgi:hypothetical protein